MFPNRVGYILPLYGKYWATRRMANLLQLDCSTNEFEILKCPCGDWSRLGLDEVELCVRRVRITGPMPTLVCDACGLRRIPPTTKVVMCNVAAEAERRGTPVVRVDVPNAAGARERFSYCDRVELKYSALDAKYIPGLARQSGFLTPVFFAKDALTYFYNHPDYAVTFESDTYGTLRTGRGDYISFGLNRAGKVIIWLGDLDALPTQDLMMLAVHNIESDHDIGSEFYEGQIEAEFTELSQEKRIIRAQGAFAAVVFDRYRGLKLLQMDAEAIKPMSALRRPLHFTEIAFGDAIEIMTKLLVERINTTALKQDLSRILPPNEMENLKKLAGLKTLELWLSLQLRLRDAAETTLPLFVLYDLRVAFKHLLPARKQEETKLECLKRLNLTSDASLDLVYTTLAAKLEGAFESMTKAAMAAPSAGNSPDS